MADPGLFAWGALGSRALRVSEVRATALHTLGLSILGCYGGKVDSGTGHTGGFGLPSQSQTQAATRSCARDATRSVHERGGGGDGEVR